MLVVRQEASDEKRSNLSSEALFHRNLLAISGFLCYVILNYEIETGVLFLFMIIEVLVELHEIDDARKTA